tara:strand:- start:3900 stop:4046 length:147 start_codon:yes stop_codon:yes gene_type:complete
MISHIGAILGAILISILVVYLAYKDWLPVKYMRHGFECSGAIGGGCNW